MSNDLRDLLKKELDQIPLRPAETWVPQDRRQRWPAPAWRLPLAVGGTFLVLIAALIGGRELANFRERTSAAGPGVVAGKAIYLSPSFNGSGWIQIDPVTLQDLGARPLLDIPATSSNSFETIVTPDGSTIIVGDYGLTAGPKLTLYDARTGKVRGTFVPEVPMGPDFISADGSLAMGRVGRTGASFGSAKVIVSFPAGRVVRNVAAGPGCCIQALPTAPDLSAIYYVTTPAEITMTPTGPLGLQPYSLVVQNTITGALSAPIVLPGITGGAILSFGSPTIASGPVTMRPAIAFTADGKRLAALSFDGQTLDVVDTATLAVTTVKVHRKISLFDLLRPFVAEAKMLNDEEHISMVFTPDGQALLTYASTTHYDDLVGATQTMRGMQRIEVATGLITAESAAAGAIYGFRVTPDGAGLLVIARTQEPPSATYVLRRFDARTLETTAERQLPDYAEIEVLAAP